MNIIDGYFIINNRINYSNQYNKDPKFDRIYQIYTRL